MIGSKGAVRAGLAVAAIAVTALLHAQMDTASAAEQGRIRVPDPEKAQLLALGFEPVIADYYWIQAVQTVGGVESDPDRNAQVHELVELVTTLDPWVDHPYRFAALWLTGSVDEVRQANAILEKGIAYHPTDWRNRFYLGYNHFFYLEDNQRAADVLESALHFPEAPAYLGAFVTRLRAAADSLDTAAIFLQQLIRETEDEFERAEYLKAFDEIETERRARILDQARQAFRERHGRDIERPDELWAGPLRVIRVMPPAHPHFEGFAWEFAETGEIVSSFYGTRYRVHVHMQDERRRRKWREDEHAIPEEATQT
ncbi:MAG: hypothetical protein AAF430_01770 [Myxococcota bacterium]